jgi:hypothetical protein
MKKIIISIFIPLLLISCSSPEWQKRGFESQEIFNDFIKDSITNSNKEAWKNSFNTSFVVASFRNIYLSNDGIQEYNTLSFSNSGILESYNSYSKIKDYYTVDYQKTEIWEGAFYGNGIDLAAQEIDGKTLHLKFEYYEDNHWKVFYHYSDGSGEDTPDLYKESPYLNVYWNYIKTTNPSCYKKL